MKSVVAFANGTGGKIIFGIADKTREVVGFEKEDVFKNSNDQYINIYFNKFQFFIHLFYNIHIIYINIIFILLFVISLFKM